MNGVKIKLLFMISKHGNIFDLLREFYEKKITKDIFDVVGIYYVDDDKYISYNNENNIQFDYIILSTKYFYEIRKFILKKYKYIYKEQILDGNIFSIQGLSIKDFFMDKKVIGFMEAIPKTPIGIIKDSTCLSLERIYMGPGKMVSLGKRSYLVDTKIVGSGKISIANWSSIARETIFEIGLNHNHNYNFITSYDFSSIYLDHKQSNKNIKQSSIHIGSDVWIGYGVHIKSPNEKKLSIGDGSVIAADSVIIKDVPPYAIVGGNPAQIIKYRFNDNIIDKLLSIKWWNWDEDLIFEIFNKYNDVNKFITDFS